MWLPGASAVGLDYLNVHDQVSEFTTSVLGARHSTMTIDRADAVGQAVRDLLRQAGDQ